MMLCPLYCSVASTRPNALTALRDQMEASLTSAATTRSRLLEALLHEAKGAAPSDQAGAAA